MTAWVGKVNLKHMPTNDDLLTTAQVAEQFVVSANTVARWGRLGIVPSIKVGGTRRYRRSDIEELLNPAQPQAAS